MAQAVRDFGAPRVGGEGARLTTPMLAAAVVAGILAVISWSIVQQSDEIRQSTAEAHVQNIVGPPCPPVATLTRPYRPVNVFDFDGVAFGRRFGASECSAVARKSLLGNGYQLVCQFSSPAVLSVKTGRGLFYFEPGVGQAATLFVADGTPRCVLASPYFASWWK
jgi:hypothetical protein